MVEEQVHVIVVAVKLEVDLPADEREAGPELEQEAFDLALRPVAGQRDL